MTGLSSNPPWRQHLQRLRRKTGASLRLRLVLVFLLLAVAISALFIGGARKAFSVSWREAARPMLTDYVDRLAADIAHGGTPSVERAQALAERLPITVGIKGPAVNWESHPGSKLFQEWHRPHSRSARDRDAHGESWGDAGDWRRMLQRRTADGHEISFGLDKTAFERRHREVAVLLLALLALTGLAYMYVRRLLRPLDDIRAGAQRFGGGDFGQAIPVKRARNPDELGQLAATINTMGKDIEQMLDAKRALLLAISHELRSPLTRARLHTELLPETSDVHPQREALLRDLQEMSKLISDLLESERLASRHAALQREPVALDELAREVLADLQSRHVSASRVRLASAPGLPRASLDAARIRLLLRNLVDNALRHGGDSTEPPELHLDLEGSILRMTVRDHGPGVPDAYLGQLAEPFFRPDSARTRAQGGVGLGLHLCKLVTEAHGGTFEVRNARPGLAVTISLPVKA